ncbi:NADH-quinone oxidoreductase subunit L [Geomesophilobacter sediminis]|uniref:NADH-quinone oxidoreductase subunit L n=1 Tax=Geomesophilobacter sediminis TaxID=2798584 RepID=A0A8J7J4U8_9BACT|nr:NADH-quinone oxidoreductase subunit L [Geomesophilobacter sediminis]MBJ6726013.1 NADH-quinone oxidoreductase subunit L [Geomesophilobacter sediminis]
MLEYVWLIPLFPLIGVLINGLFGKKIKNEAVIGGIATLAVVGSFVVACGILFQLISMPGEERHFEKTIFTWIQSGTFKADIGFLVDPLSAVMLMVVTGVGSLIHLYSIGYMHGEEGFYRYFTYLNLFTFSMLLLVSGNNLLLMFVGWEGVGLCSYLLIGYYFHKKSAGDAGKKAFVMNRVGDFGFLLGLFTMWWFLGHNYNVWTINFRELASHADLIPAGGVATAIGLFFFLGATGKSAQIPLYTWLPDAMEGPTPVSALIHAATMVTAGVYMIGRMNFVYIKSPTALLVVACVGGATALFAATIGTAQNDIKRVLAYSTVSQLGYMFLAMGVGAFTAGIFHLMTHAFFKACLFLGSGSVIHAMHHALHHVHSDADPQDMRNMGGLRKKMPITFLTFLIATIAIAGIPGFAGFFSKDEILWQAFSNPLHGEVNIVLWAFGAVAALLTAFYMFRLVFMTFFGETKLSEKAYHHLHESPAVITIPLICLAILSVLGGYIGMPKLLGEVLGGMPNYFEHWLEPVFAYSNNYMAHSLPGAHGEHSPALEWGLMGVSVLIACCGIAFAYALYIVSPTIPEKFTSAFPALHRAVYKKWYVDEIYDFCFVNPCKALGGFLWKGFDVVVVDGIVNGVAGIVKGFSGILRYSQTGYVHNYAYGMVLGTVVIVAVYVFR